MIKNNASQIKDALYASNGLIRLAAKRLDVSSTGLRARIKRNKELQVVLSEAREQIVDKAEESLWTCLDKLEPWAIALVLKTLGKERGYVERQEVTGKDGGAVEIVVVRSDKKRVSGQPSDPALNPGADQDQPGQA